MEQNPSSRKWTEEVGLRGGRLCVGRQRGRRKGCAGTFPSPCPSPRQPSSPSHHRLSTLVRSCSSHLPPVYLPSRQQYILSLCLLESLLHTAFPPTTCLRVHGIDSLRRCCHEFFWHWDWAASSPCSEGLGTLAALPEVSLVLFPPFSSSVSPRARQLPDTPVSHLSSICP